MENIKIEKKTEFKLVCDDLFIRQIKEVLK